MDVLNGKQSSSQYYILHWYIILNWLNWNVSSAAMPFIQVLWLMRSRGCRQKMAANDYHYEIWNERRKNWMHVETSKTLSNRKSGIQDPKSSIISVTYAHIHTYIQRQNNFPKKIARFILWNRWENFAAIMHSETKMPAAGSQQVQQNS